MKKIFSFAAIAALITLTSCVQEDMPDLQEQQTPQLSQEREVAVVANAQTKTVLNGDDIHWESTDKVALMFVKNSTKHISEFATTDSGLSATFVGKLPNEVSVAGGYAAQGYAVYPSSAVSNDAEVSFTLPAAVTANENGSFDSGMNLSSAHISLADLDASGETSTEFKNAFSVIRFSVSSGVKSVKISAATGNLAGTAILAFNDSDSGRLKVSSWTSGSKEITITSAGATFTSGKAYNVLVYPGQYVDLTAELTDTDGCKYVKTVKGTFDFEPSLYYQFNFGTKFEKTYSFTATGRTFSAGDQIQTVFGNLHSEVLTAASGSTFTGNLPAEVAHANTAGYAVYPASAYSAGHISYTLDPLSPAELWSAALTPSSTTVSFNSVASALGTVNFSVPTGVKSVKIVSDKAFAGMAEMTVSGGKLVAGTGSGKEINVSTSQVGNYSLKVYPVSGAALTVTITDGAGATVVKNFTLTVAAGGSQTLDVASNLVFDKNGNFSTESFGNGGNYDF